jgi:hypothetical protein
MNSSWVVSCVWNNQLCNDVVTDFVVNLFFFPFGVPPQILREVSISHFLPAATEQKILSLLVNLGRRLHSLYIYTPIFIHVLI